MKLLKRLMLLVQVFVLASCVNHNRVDTLIFEYTEHMEIYFVDDSTDGDEILYYGNATLGVEDNGEAGILVSRFNEKEQAIIAIGIIGELYNGLFEDRTFVIEDFGFISYSMKLEDGYQISLETPTYIADELMTVDFDSYVESLKELTYDDILYAMETTLQRSY